MSLEHDVKKTLLQELYRGPHTPYDLRYLSLVQIPSLPPYDLWRDNRGGLYAFINTKKDAMSYRSISEREPEAFDLIQYINLEVK